MSSDIGLHVPSDPEIRSSFELQLAHCIQEEMSAICGEPHDAKSAPSELAQGAAHVALIWMSRSFDIRCTCGRIVTLDQQYRCFDCKEVFCDDCKRKHMYTDDNGGHAIHAAFVKKLRETQAELSKSQADRARMVEALKDVAKTRNFPSIREIVRAALTTEQAEEKE